LETERPSPIHSDPIPIVSADCGDVAAAAAGTATDVCSSPELFWSPVDSRMPMGSAFDAQSNLPIVACDVHGSILDISARGVALLGGTSRDSALSRSLPSLASESRRREVQNLFDYVCHGHAATLDFECTGWDGTKRWLKVLATPLRGGSPESLVDAFLILHDVTALHRQQEEVAERHRELLDWLSNCRPAIQDLVQDLSIVRSALSHDFRSPLGAISGFSHILVSKHLTTLNPDVSRCAVNIASAADRLTRMVEDLSQYTRMSAWTPRQQPVELAKLLGPILRSIQARLQHPEDRVIIPSDLPTVISDSVLLALIFSKLLDNALLYRREGEPAHVKLTVASTERAFVFRIEDDGLGIAREYRERVFGAFQRLHAHDKYPGVGMGLTLARRAAGLLRGSITIEGHVGVGTTMCVELPNSSNPDLGADY
jgi:PAS domain S-box-containing protein